MSKEQLEKLLNDLPHSIRYSGEMEPLKQFVREQAERVQELEDIIYQDERQAVLEGLYERNKRYREAYSYLKNSMKFDRYVCHEKCQDVVSVKDLEEGLLLFDELEELE